MIGSSKDHNVALLEISPKKFGVYQVPNQPYLSCTNHFQSDVYKDDFRNNKQINESHSVYRFQKIQEHLNDTKKLDQFDMVNLLRDTNGLKNKALGYGNEKALNQLLAHHAIVFQPDKKLVWVSSNPYQLGEFTAYDLNKIFKDSIQNYKLNVDSLVIQKDNFLTSEAYKKYEEFRIKNAEIETYLDENKTIETNFLTNYINTNAEYWVVYANVADYYFKQKDYLQAINYYKLALSKEITTIPDRNKIEKNLKKCLQKTAKINH